MRISTLLARNLAWYWRTNLAVVAGVATAAAALGGALVVGDSVRASLRNLAAARLGQVDYVVASDGYFAARLADALPQAAPMIALEGVVTHEASGRRAAAVEVYGVDERFWKLADGAEAGVSGRQTLVSAALAHELTAAPGDTLLVRVARYSAIPLESLHGARDDAGKTLRLDFAHTISPGFSLRAKQGDVRAMYVSLPALQREIGATARANTIAGPSGAQVEDVLHREATPQDAGLRIRGGEAAGHLTLESDSAVLSDYVVAAAEAAAHARSLHTTPVLAYLANTIRANGREVPYSVIAGVANDAAVAPANDTGIVLNAWTAAELKARPGDVISLDYYKWESTGRLATAKALFTCERIVPMTGEPAAQDWTPDYPGITAARSLRDWNPPFPLELARIRPADEAYWDRYRTAPKAFLTLARGRALFATRFGSVTGLRISPPGPRFASDLRAALDPALLGLRVEHVRAAALAAATGSTDFGEYFVYFSFFLIAAALLLTGLFFRLGIEQRMREVGLLRALGYAPSAIARIMLLEAAVVACVGAALGTGAAPAYGALVLLGLRTWWVDAVGTRLLTLAPAPESFAIAALAGIVTGLAAAAWTLRGLGTISPRALLAGSAPEPARAAARTARWLAPTATVAALVVVAMAAPGGIDRTAGFFGGGTLLLVASLAWISLAIRGRGVAAVTNRLTLGVRNVAWRPGRSILSITLVASATFLIVALDAFRSEGSQTGTGGYELMAESAVPVVNDPNSFPGVRITPFRVRAGDDASCLNLYQPKQARVIGAPASFFREAGFSFAAVEGGASHPWQLLDRPAASGATPAIADANALEYSLHRKLGEEFVSGGVRYRIVAALADSILQGQLIISEANFLRLFPSEPGYRFFLITAPAGQLDATGTALAGSLSDYGFTVESTAAHLAALHRVENTYLATFRALGGLGLLLGTIGLAVVVLRNVLERRRELALLTAIGYRPRDLALLVLAENLFLLLSGLAAGALSAGVAVVPALAAQGGGRLPGVSLAVLLILVVAAGLLAALAATRIALRTPVLEALRSE